MILHVHTFSLLAALLAVQPGEQPANRLPKRERGVALEPLKNERFDKDPGWEGFNNRIVPKQYPTVVQDFGYSTTNIAGKTAGEIGGRITRASEPAFYAEKIGPKTLNDKLTASGSFALTKTTPGSGMFFGFFRAEQPGGGGRPAPRIHLARGGYPTAERQKEPARLPGAPGTRPGRVQGGAVREARLRGQGHG